MDELVARIAADQGLGPKSAERAVGIVLAMVRREGDPAKVAALFARLPGAAALADRYQPSGAAAWLGRLTGALGGGALSAVSDLKAAGLDMDQIKAVGAEVLRYAREQAGEDLVREVARSIPGLAQYL